MLGGEELDRAELRLNAPAGLAVFLPRVRCVEHRARLRRAEHRAAAALRDGRGVADVVAVGVADEHVRRLDVGGAHGRGAAVRQKRVEDERVRPGLHEKAGVAEEGELHGLLLQLLALLRRRLAAGGGLCAEIHRKILLCMRITKPL